MALGITGGEVKATGLGEREEEASGGPCWKGGATGDKAWEMGLREKHDVRCSQGH